MRLWPLAVLILQASAAFGQGTSVQQSIEMPAHRGLLSTMNADGVDLLPFTTDGCSGGMSWSWRVVSDMFPDFEASQGAEPPWENCCVIHDQAYHNAGGATSAEDSYAERLAADEALRLCVVTQGEGEVARLAVQYEVSEERVRQAYGMIGDARFNAVRRGGAPCSVLPWRWGYGYPLCLPEF